MGKLPEDRIRVFISSAQRDENGFLWEDIRKKIKITLNECKYFNAFLIEDNPSSIPSTQLMQLEVSKADVVVQIVKGEYRQGTSDEFIYAIQYNKPLLVIFLDDTFSSEVAAFKNKLNETDPCTYCIHKDENSLPIFVKEKLISDIIKNYQRIPIQREEEKRVLAIDNDDSLQTDEVVNKTTISFFDSCYSYLFELLNINYLANNNDNTISEFHNLGKKLLVWLVTDQFEISYGEISKLIDKLSRTSNNKELLFKRWDAIHLRNSGDYKNAFLREKEALEIARVDNKSQWIINDILLDCRNLEGMYYNCSGCWIDNMTSQSELNKSETIVHFPVVDRYAKNIYEYIYNDEFNRESLPPDSIPIGTDFRRALSDVMNYYFSAVIYGSDTHMVLARNLLIKVLYKYGNLTNDMKSLFWCIRLNILNGNVKDLDRLIDFKWNELYPMLAVKSDELYRLAYDSKLSNRSSIILKIVEKVGMYCSDEIFISVEKYYLEYAELLERHKTEIYLKSLKTIMRRFNQDYLIDIMKIIIEKNNYVTAYRISDILSNIDYDLVSNDRIFILRDLLLDRWTDLVKNNADPQLIAVLNLKNKEVFECLEDLPENGLVGIQKSIYEINVGKNHNWLDILVYEIESAKKQFDSNNNLSAHVGYASNPYNMISQIIRKPSVDEEVINVIVEKFIPLTEEIISSNVDIETKNNCISCLCDVLIALKNWKISIPNNVRIAINNMDINKGTEFLSSQNRKVLSIRVLMCKIVVGEAGIDDLLSWCYEYENMNRNERVALINCIERYLAEESSILEEDRILLSITFRCAGDKEDSIRQVASKCLAYYSKSQNREQINDMLIKLSCDPSHNVRHVLFLLCRDNKIEPQTRKMILENLNNDLNYIIRTESLEINV